MSIKTYKPGAEIIHENQLSRKMFIIKKGKVRIIKEYLGQKITMATIGPGGVFGELSFIDAEPRSATVEAITQVEVLELSPEDAGSSLEKLPPWVFSILKVLCKRFRELDQKFATLQSMNEFQAKVGNPTNKSKNIYMELQRFNKLLLMVLKNLEVTADFNTVFAEMDTTSGGKMINLRDYLRKIVDHGLVDCDYYNVENLYLVDRDKMAEFDQYLKSQSEDEQYIILSYSAIKVLGHLIENSDAEDDRWYEIERSNFYERNFPLLDEALAELIEHDIIKDISKKGSVEKYFFNSRMVRDHFVYQNIIKSFDHDIKHHQKATKAGL